MSDQIHLFEAVIPCRIGITAEERASPQNLVMDLSMRLDLRPAAHSEDLSDTVDYVHVLDLMHQIASLREWVLVESLAETICAAVLRNFPLLSVRLLLRKPGALYGRNVKSPAIEMERFRSASGKSE